MDEPDGDTLGRCQQFYEGRLAITHFHFSRFASPASYLVVSLWTPIGVPAGNRWRSMCKGQFLFRLRKRSGLRDLLWCAVEQELIKQSLALSTRAHRLHRRFPDAPLKRDLIFSSKGNRQRVLEELGSVNLDGPEAGPRHSHTAIGHQPTGQGGMPASDIGRHANSTSADTRG